MTTKHERLSVSLRADLVAYVKDEAAKGHTTHSAIVADALRFLKSERLRRKIMEGVREDWEEEFSRQAVAKVGTDTHEGSTNG